MKLTPIEVVRGRDFEIMFVFDDNIALWFGKAQLRKTASMSSDLLGNFSVSIGAYQQLTDPLTTRTFWGCPVTMQMPRTTSNGIEEDTGFYDLMLTDLNGYTKTYVAGPVAIVDVPTQV